MKKTFKNLEDKYKLLKEGIKFSCFEIEEESLAFSDKILIIILPL
ncbi:MAG: hypothetical protein Q4A58_05125 [Fusobacterium sp.]|nr:hypothetical protein [Fusobacterium sp.]MDO4690660.1 hypothetical protein [Fusobacterium sp.]